MIMNIPKKTAVSLLTVATILLTACGDPWPGEQPPPPPPPLNPEAVQQLVGADEPSEEPGQALLRILQMGSKVDSFLVSNGYLETGTEDDVVITASCERKSCSFHFPGRPDVTFATNDLFPPPSSPGSGAQSGSGAGLGRNTKAILSAEGITLLQSNPSNSSIFYAVLNNSAFGTIRMRNPLTGRKGVFSGVVGDRSENRSYVSGIWKGQTTGVTKVGQRDFLQGTAFIGYTFSDTGGDIWANFAGIKNVSQNKAHSIEDINFINVPVELEGNFSKTETDGYIKGAFYGNGAEEITGIFEKSGMLGAFGTKKQ